MNFEFLANFSIALLAILNPIGVLPLFISATKKETKGVKRALALFIALMIFVILFVFLILGDEILRFFSISIPAFRIAGGILILLSAINMALGRKIEIKSGTEEEDKGSDFEQASKKISHVLVPLTIPILVGPGAIGTVIVYSNNVTGYSEFLLLIVGVIFVSLVSGFLFMSSEKAAKILGEGGIQIATCLLGLFLSCIAVQFMIDGIFELAKIPK